MASAAAAPRDPNTVSNYNEWRTRHSLADLAIDFKAQKLSGTVTLQLESQTSHESHQIVLDSSYVDVTGVSVNGAASAWTVAPRAEPYGSPVTIDVPGGADRGSLVTVAMNVSTTAQCTALQWLAESQTSNGKFPYMFSQCQAIHARSIFPCQDTPDVKSTYTFKIRSPLPVVASGLPKGAAAFQHGADGESGTLLYEFEQKVPIPSYLFAVASGDIASATIGPRSCVHTGPEELLASKWELERDMEKFIEKAEAIVFEYPWTQYNALILPPSFPYGGMENPIFTFATPTIISGDRENVDVIAHELAHSWSGNLVSNASWEHFWLNEGWTVYLERRLIAALHGEPHRDFSAIIGWKALQDSVDLFGHDHEFTKMVVDLKGKDPDDAFSSIPYEKGFHFLYYLEKLVGKDKWDTFIPHYFTKWQKKSLDSFEFKDTLLSFFASDAAASNALSTVDWDTWYYKPGMPPKPVFDTTMVDKCYALADKWEKEAETFRPTADDVAGWTANQLVVFLERVQRFATPLTPAQSRAMGSVYSLTTSHNVELTSRYYCIALAARDETAYHPAADLLGTVGRMKFVRPLYRALMAADRSLARATFEKNKLFYHPICAGLVEKDFAEV